MKPEWIVWHCSASRWGRLKEIDKWHRERGWDGVGYHAVILNGNIERRRHSSLFDGNIELGRSFDEVGAHVKGLNSKSIGICLVGEKGRFTHHQIESAVKLTKHLQSLFKIPTSKVIGHYEIAIANPKLKTSKTCPDIPMKNVRDWLDKNEGFLGLLLNEEKV